LREKITHFDHERIPERIVHARATGVHGYFELTTSLEQHSIARVLTEVGVKTAAQGRSVKVARWVTRSINYGIGLPGSLPWRPGVARRRSASTGQSAGEV
jgi:hypothetical protein